MMARINNILGSATLKKILDFFGLNTQSICGIDLSSSAIKVLQINKKGDRFIVDNYAIKYLNSGIIKDKKIIDRQAVVEAIKAVMLESKIIGKKVCIAIPSAIAISKTIEVDSIISDKDVGNEILLEADKHIPYPIAEVNIDYEILKDKITAAGKKEVILVACKTEDIDQRVAIFTDAGLEVEVVDIESFALQRAFSLVTKLLPNNGQDKIVGLVDIGSNVTSLNIFHNNSVIYSRDQNFSGSQLFDEIQSRYGLSFQEALIARERNELPEDFILEVLEPFKEAVVSQINRACQFFLSSGNVQTIDYLLLTGGVSIIAGLDESLQQVIGVKTFIANPFLNMNCYDASLQQRIISDSSLLMACCGLALRNVIDK
jgi:type IV pilus assembly protein PilM